VFLYCRYHMYSTEWISAQADKSVKKKEKFVHPFLARLFWIASLLIIFLTKLSGCLFCCLRVVYKSYTRVSNPGIFFTDPDPTENENPGSGPLSWPNLDKNSKFRIFLAFFLGRKILWISFIYQKTPWILKSMNI